MKKILWIFFTKYPDNIASYRMSGIPSAENLKIPKVIYLEDANEVDFLNHSRPNVLIFAKPFHSKAIDLAKYAKQLGMKLILTCDDWNFIENSNNPKDDVENIVKRNKIMTEIAKVSDRVVVKTNLAAEIAFKNSGIKCDVIPDCLEKSGNKTIKKINLPLKVGWFGNNTNLDTLLFGIKQISMSKNIINLKIVTNLTSKKEIDNFKICLKKINLKHIKINFIQWNINYDKLLEDVEIIMIPYIDDDVRKVKSLHRVIESLNMGKIVICNDTSTTKDLHDYCVLGRINEGIEWVINNQELAIKKAGEGREWVLKNYSVKTISSQWLELINQINE